MSHPPELPLEPELEGSTYQTAPITALAIARWPWAVAGLLVGAILGFLVSFNTQYQAIASVQLSVSSSDPNALTTLGQSVERYATAQKTLEQAAKDANVKRCPNADADWLSSHVRALWESSTTIVSITADTTDPNCAVYAANAVANAVRTVALQDADAQIAAIQKDTQGKLVSGTVAAAGDEGESERKKALGQQAGQTMGTIIASANAMTVITTKLSNPSGPSPSTAALLGAAGGAFLGALASVAAGAGRRRPHSPRELVSLAPDLTVRTTVQAGELAGRVLETDRRSVVVLAMPDTRFAATQLAMAIAHHLRTHGATVAVVDRISEFNPSSASEDRLWALRRDVRRNIPANFSADMLVVVCGADEEALSLIAGQSDLLVAVVAKQRKSILGDIRRTVDAVRVSEPVVVLAR